MVSGAEDVYQREERNSCLSGLGRGFLQLADRYDYVSQIFWSTQPELARIGGMRCHWGTCKRETQVQLECH